MDEEILGSVLHGIKPKDYTPIQVRPTPEFGGIQLTEEQQAKKDNKDNMESVKDGEILPLGGFTDTVEAQWESAKDLVKSTDVYKNLFGNSAPDDNRLEQSEKLGSALGIAPQLIASDPDMYKAAVTTYERQRNAAALNNQPFSAKTLNELYPELDTEDPVATTIALKDYTNILKNREAAAQGAAVYTMPESKLTDLSNVIGYLYDTGTHFAGTAYEAGQALDAQSELMYKASIGEISDEEVEKAIPDLMNAQKAYNAEIGDSYVAKIVGETISQLSMQKNMIMRGAAEVLAPIAPLAQPILAATKTNLPQIATLGAASAAGAVGATGAVAGAAVTGAAALTGLIALGTASVFTGTYRAEAGQAYWDWRTKKDKNGKSVYTREQAIGHAKRVGRINAAIETGAWELALKGITKVWGSDAAKAVIKNEAAMKKLIGAGRAAVGAKAIGYGAKQFAKVAAPEIAEEGLQSLSADIDTNLFGKETVPVREMMGNALDAMIEAVPSVVGMSIGGAALAGAGAHRAMKRITGLSEMKDAVIEFKRENERSMLQKLMDLRSESSLYKKAPETYRKTLQNQLDRTGSGTLYIDASAAAENEKTHDALNKLVEDGTITAKELDDAIKTGKPLEVETGKYMQTATPETHEALSDYTTMDKGEKTIHAIREERQRMKDMIDIVTMTREKREAAASEKILNDHFSEDTDIGREDRDTAREILSGGLDHIEDTCKTILQEAKDAWGELTGVKELQDYMERRKTQDANFSNEKGVDFIDVGEGKDRVHLRISKNPGWYQDFYDSYGRAPTQRELYDIAQEKIIAENDKGDDESKAAIAEIEEAKKRVESIERVSETLKSLNKEDLIAQTLLDPETYEEAYKPLLEEIKAAGNGAVTKAARDSALVLAKLAENFHKNYGVPLKLAMIAAGEVSPETAHQLNQSAIENELQLVKEKYWNTDEWMKAPDGTPTKLTERQWLITHSEAFKKWFGNWETVEKYNRLMHSKPVECNRTAFRGASAKEIGKAAKELYRALFPVSRENGKRDEPAVIRNRNGEYIRMPVSAAKELVRHSAENSTLQLIPNLKELIAKSVFLYEDVKDPDRVKKLNQSTVSYRYYGMKIKLDGKECFARIVVREEANGRKYFYDGDITEIKKNPAQTGGPDSKNGVQSEGVLFTHSIQEWLAKVKETTDKIGGNGEVLPSVVNDFEESSTYYQTAAEKNLVAMHNIDLGNLAAAIKLGGFPVPSIAVTKKQTPYTGFGDATLIMKKDTIDPSKTPVFSRDAWTGVFPKVIRLANMKRLTSFVEKVIEPLQEELPREAADYGDIYDSYILRNANNKNGDVQKMLEDSLNSAGYKYYFLKTINKEPKLKWRKKGLNKELIDHPEILQACQGLEKKYGKQGLKELLYEGPFAMLEESTDLKEVNDLIVNELSKKPEGNESPFLKRVHERQQARLVNGETLHSLLSDYLERDKKVFEGESFKQQLDKRIKANQNTFNAWKESFRDEMLGESVIRDSGKPADLENIVDAMLGNLKNAQKSFAGFGIGNIIASSAKKIESFGEMHREADRNMDESTNIETGLDKSEQYTKVKDEIIDFTDRMAEAYKWEGSWESRSDASQVLMSMMSGKTFKASARKFDFTYSAALEKQAKEIIKEVKALPVKYFEAKPQRAVRFSEVAAAVMPKNASKEIKDYLRAQGVTIRLYDPRIEGDRERVTNSAQDRVKQYFQEGSNYQGSYDRNANVIELFDGANESTVIHEGAHMFLSMLENMSQMSEENVATYFNGNTAKARAALKSMQGVLSTIRSWAAFSEDHLSEYKGTILEKEFTRYAEDIRTGKAGAMERWMQERFARGFEKYLMDGSAPTKEMQGVLRRFKKWLTDIYKTTRNLGNVELTPEIKDIFDRMISTEAEINAWAAQRKLEVIDKTIDVNQSELGNLKAWAESVKDKALEKAMSYYLHMVKEEAIENFKASISSEEERTSFIESLGEENEIYQIETIYNSDTFPTKRDRDEFLQMAGFTEKDLKEKLRAAGGTTEERWNKHIEDMVQHYREEALTPEAIRGMAEEILRSPEGMAKKSRIEAMLLEKKVSAYIHLVNSMQMELKRSKDKKKTAREIRKRLGLVSEKETTEIDKQTDVIAKSEDKIAKLEKQKKLLKEQLEKAKAEAAAAKGENKSRKESQTILEGNIRALEAELEKERAQRAKADSTTKDAELTAADLAVQLQTMVDGLKESRDAMRFDMREIKEDARNTLGGEKLSHATSWRWWENKAQIAEARAMKAAADNDWEGAAYWKREQAQCLTMAKFARANEEEIRRTLHGGGGKVTTPLLNENGMERYGILGILNRISRTDKPVLMKDDARYFVQHMAYVLGLTKKDGILPIDESGQERPFNWRWLAIEMNPMQAMDNENYFAEDIIPGWMRSAFEGSTHLKLKDLTMDQFREMAKVMKAVYKLGRREYEGNTLGTSFDEASQKIHDEILGNWTHRVATPGLKNQTATSMDRLGTKIHSLIKDITLPEILIERLGKSAAEYFYKPMDKAAAHLRELKSAARVTFRKNFAIYSRKEWTAIRSKKLYTVGLDERGKPVSYTKEQLLAMALNFGTKSNRERLIETLWLSDTLNTDEKTILDMLDKNLTDKDWDFVESVWEHLNSYWGERNKVQNDLYGTPLGKVQGEDFTLKSGRIIHGAYYRIKYDPLSSTKTSNFSTTDIAKMDMQNISSFSLGMGSTKQRAGTSGGQKLRLDLDVYVEAVNEAMQHIAMREATVDVYKLLNRKEVVAAIENTAGPETLSLLQGWAKDCWHSSIKDMSEWDSTLGRARRRFNFTTMGFRFSTALLNIGNITGMMDRMGAMNALKAVGDFYFHGNIVEQRRFIQNKSTMMRDRGATIDRDMFMQDRLPVGKNESELRSKIEHGKYGVDTLNAKAYWLIQATDEMFSLPEWLYTYKNAMAVMEVDGKLTREEMDAEAVRLADKAVRETFGSNETKDQTSFTRKNGILAQMTTFYSYTNLVTNQFIRAGYILYDKGDVKPLLAATWYWWILGALVETALRESGDDSDDEDKWKKKFLHVIASGGPIGGVPLLREAVPWTVDFFTGKSFGSAAPDAPFFDMLKHMENFLKAAKKGDMIEMGRGATKAITRTSIPVPDTITDAFWNFMRMACTDTEFTMWDWIRKSLWDKTLKEKKK